MVFMKRSPMFILSQSVGRKKGQVQTPTQTAGTRTEHSSLTLRGHHFQIPYQDSFRRDVLWIRHLLEQMPDKFVTAMRCRRMRVTGSWHDFCQNFF